MSTSPAPQRDPLATLRIDRNRATAPTVRRGRKRGWVFFLLAFLVVGLGAWFGFTRLRNGGDAVAGSSWLEIPDVIKNRIEVRVVRPVVQRGRSADATVVATGYLESRRQAKIGARAPGRVEVVHVEEGSRVTKDEILAVLEHADLDASLSAMSASVARSRASLAEQSILIAQNLREFKRMQGLTATDSISQNEYDAAKYQYDSSVARLESMQADVALAEARLKEAEQLRENMFIRAPFDGTVISKDAEVGESILPGGMGEASGRGSAVTIADLEHIEVECDVKEDYINRVRAEQGAEIAVDAVPSKRYHGVVRKVIPMGDRARATIKVKVTITDNDERLFPDMSCTVYFLPDPTEQDTAEDLPRMFCPSDAVVSDDQGDAVWIVDTKGHAKRIPVTIGKQRDNRTEILTGLEGDEKVIVKPTALTDGQALKVIE